MLSKEVVELSKQHSIIRDIFEYGMKRAKEVGAEKQQIQWIFMDIQAMLEYWK